MLELPSVALSPPTGRPHHLSCTPSDCAAGAAVGDNVTFTVVYFANPDPRENQWDWSFVSINSSMSESEQPGSVTFTVHGGYVLLTVNDITPSLFGNYTVTSWNGIGEATSTLLMLISEGKFNTVFEI